MLLKAVMLTACSAFMLSAPVAQKTSMSALPVPPWESDLQTKVLVDYETLDAAFLAANGAALDAKIAAAVSGTGMSASDAKSKLIGELGELGVLQADAKKLKGVIAPPKKE